MKHKFSLSVWRSCLLLLLLGMISIILGVVQLESINNNTAGAAYLTTPLPVVIHIVCGIIFNLLSPFQFVSSVRERFPLFHRYSGRVLALCAISVALTALWMNQFYPSYGGALKYSGIVAYNIVLLGAIWLAIKYIRNKNIKEHKLWMMRAMAAALGPATQRLIILPVFMIFGEEVLTEWFIGLLIWSGLIINLVFVEYIHFKQQPDKPRMNTNLTSQLSNQ